MKRKLVLYPLISRLLRTFGLEREALIQFLTALHQELPERYASLCHHRAPDVRKFYGRIVVPRKGGGAHLFVVVVDDTTSPDHLFVTDIGHRIA